MPDTCNTLTLQGLPSNVVIKQIACSKMGRFSLPTLAINTRVDGFENLTIGEVEVSWFSGFYFRSFDGGEQHQYRRKRLILRVSYTRELIWSLLASQWCNYQGQRLIHPKCTFA